MLKIISEKIEEGFKIIQFSRNGIDVSHTVREPILLNSELDFSITDNPSVEEQILFENKYQTMILEMGIF